MTGYELTETIQLYMRLRDDFEQNPKPLEQFTFDLVEHYLKGRMEIDAKLKAALINWDFTRLSLIDRTLMQLATAELLFFDDIPPRVTINEYIEVAKKFGDDESPQFINGVLDRVARSEQFDLTNVERKVRANQ